MAGNRQSGEWRPPTIPPCRECGGVGEYQNVYGSFCHKHYEELWAKLTLERTNGR
jgi:hypothetical protein